MNYIINHKKKEKREIEKIDEKTIQDLIRKEFIDSCDRILIDIQTKFIDHFFEKIILIIKNYYDQDVFKKIKSLYQIINQNKINFINNIYSPMFKLCSLAIKQYNSNNLKNIGNIKISYLKNYLPHCINSKKNSNNSNNNSSNINPTAIHICGGKFIIIENSNINSNNNTINKKNNSYIICTKCKKCYFPNSIPMICCFCFSFYYSEIIPEYIKKDNCYLATWSKYHCKNMNNEKMSCIKCGEDFWIKNNKLFCKNCKFEIEPINIIWTCLICNTDFNSNAKIYNPLEFKEAQLILKEALIYKKIAKPIEFPCKCITNENQIDQINFFHRIKNNYNKKECKGVLYYCEINNKKFLVCSLCLNIYSINKYKWNCPICFKPFTTLKLKIFYLKTNNNYNNIIILKNNMTKSNVKNKLYKNNSKKKIHTISILDTDNSHKNKNNEKYLSPSKNELTSIKIRNVNSYIKKKPKDIHRISSYYSSSSKDLLVKNNNNRIKINLTTNNRSITNNSSNNRINQNVIRKNNTINNGCLYSLNFRKKRNLSEIPNEMKNDIYFIVSKNNKHENKYHSGTGSTIFSSLSNYNLYSPKETIIKSALEQSLKNNINKVVLKTVENNNNITNNKKIINNINNYNLHKNKKINIIDNDKICCNFKIPKRINIINSDTNNYNENSQKMNNKSINFENNSKTKNNSININKINTINYENDKKNINNIVSQKNRKKIEYMKKIDNKIDYNESDNNFKIFSQKFSKKKKGNKSFYITDKNFILFSPENEIKKNKENNENNKFIKNKRNSKNNNENIYKINEPQPQPQTKQKIPHKEYINSKIIHKNKEKENNQIDYFSYYSNDNENTDKYNKKKIYINNLTINNNSNSNYNINHNNSISIDYNIKNKKNISFEKIHKIKNINISINSPKLNDIINYNLSFSKIKNGVLNKNKRNNTSVSSKLSSKGNISNSQTNNSNLNTDNNNTINNLKLKKFNFEEYTIITQLGQGSFGKIYLVKDTKGNTYSMKKILLSEELDVKNVISEYNMCYNFSHPNIIKILGVYSNKLDKTTFVVYVLMEVGISDWEKEINSYKSKKIFYSEADLVNILKQLISSLSFLQKNNISHRDIKPQNILIFKNKIYKLTDFGEARKISERDKNNKSLVQYSLKGTELYMSPLLFNGLRTGQIDIKHNTYKSDVYSLGLCLLYAATTCDKKLFEIRRLIEMEKIKNFVNNNLKDNYSEKFINIIISMLEIHEEKRPDFLELEKIIQNF